MKKHLFLLDPGHGGIKDGIPQTPGKRSPWPVDGQQLIEGEFTRAIVERIIDQAPAFDLICKNLVPEIEDISLRTRVDRAYELHMDNLNLYAVYVSIHSNAGGGHGIEVFTSPGQTAADPIATVFLKRLQQAFPSARMRIDMSDGDPDKEENFYVLRKTVMPAILIECFFMDNEDEVRRYLLSESGRDEIAKAMIAAMVELEKDGG